MFLQPQAEQLNLVSLERSRRMDVLSAADTVLPNPMDEEVVFFSVSRD